LISAKFSATLYDQHTSCKTVARCLALYDALTTTGAALAFGERGKPEDLHRPLTFNNYSKQKQTISCNPANCCNLRI